MTLKQRIGRWLIPRLPISPALFMKLRFEANSLVCHARNKISPSYHRRVKKMRGERGLNLNVGSGGRGLTGWVNTDAVGHSSDQTFSCDIRRGIPLSDGSVARIFAEHVIEHLDFKHELPKVLGEFHRILDEGGLVRIVVPDGRRFTQAYLGSGEVKWASLGIEPFPADMPTPMAMLNHVFHQEGEHHFAYDFETLEWALRISGFKNIRQCSFGQSSDPLLAIDREEHAPYSLYVEAMKS